MAVGALRRRPGRSGSPAVAQRERQLERLELVGRRVACGGDVRGRDGGLAGRRWSWRRQPVLRGRRAGSRRGPRRARRGGASAASGSRSRSTAARDELVAEADRAVAPRRGSRARCASVEPGGRGRRRGRRSPRRGPLTERGAGRIASRPRSCRDRRELRRGSSGRPAGARSRRTRRHSSERTPSRPMTSSSSEPVSDAVGSSRRAASSSSATSGLPPDRSATRSSRLADGRSPSIAFDEPAPARRGRAAASVEPFRRVAARPAIAARSLAHGSSRGTTSGWSEHDEREPLVRGAIRARNVTSARVAASARWRSSRTRRTGLPLAEPAEHAEHALERARLAPLRAPSSWRRDGRAAGRSVAPRARAGAGPTSSAGGPERRPRSSSSDSASRAGPSARTTGPYGSSAPAGTPPAQDASSARSGRRRGAIGLVEEARDARRRPGRSMSIARRVRRPRRRGRPRAVRRRPRARRTARSCTGRAWPHSRPSPADRPGFRWRDAVRPAASRSARLGGDDRRPAPRPIPPTRSTS